MPSSSAYPMSSPRTSAFSEFSLVPARAPDNYQDIHYKNQQHCDSPVLDHGNMTSTSASTSSASHNLPAAPDREKLLIMEQARATPHVRTNFRRGYHPPATKDNPVRRPPPIERQENSDASKPRTSDTSDRSDEMPFDVKNDKIKPPHQQQQRQQHGAGQPRHPPTTWAAREELDPGRGRFVITPPKYSDPTSLNSVHHPTATYGFRRDEEKSVVTTLGMAGAASTLTGRVEDHYSSPHRVIAPTPDPCDNYEEFGISLGTIRARTGRKGEIDNPEDEDSLFEFELESSSHPPGLPKIGSNRKSTHVQHRRRRAQRQQQQHEHAVVEEDDRDDDTASLEEIPYGHKTPSPTNLHERTTQAWAVRREKVSSLKTNKSKEDTRPKMQTKSKEEPITPTSPSKEESLIKQGVSFGQTDTVHHFQPHIVEDDDDGTFGTYNSVEDHSLNSEYTKTIESEVEDVIKDILFIGTEFKSKPGRRKLKYRHEVKRKLQQQKMKIYEGDEASAGADDKTNDAETDDVAVISKYLVNISNDQKATPSNPVKSRNSKNKVSSTLEKSSQQKTARHIERRNSLEETPPSNSPIRSTRESERRAKTEKQTSKAHREEKEEDDDPFLAMWGYVEGGMKAMSEALGLDPDPTETTEKKASSSSSKTSSSLSQKKAAKSSSTRSKSSDKNLCTDQIALILSGDEACPYSPTKTTRKAAPMVEADQGLDGFIDYAQDTMFGPLPSIGTGGSGSSDVGGSKSHSQSVSIEFDVDGSKSQSQSVSIDDDDTAEDDIDDVEHDPEQLSAFHLDESHLDERDPRLGHLALNAARSKHQIRGAEFDESITIDLLSEVKIKVLELKLPLGLVFLENDGGCFVTQVSPNGSAARSGGVEVGDQLAAINGISSIEIKVDGIITAISAAPDKKCIELMFVRYEGPFRPAAAKSLARPISSGREAITRVNQPEKKEKEKKGLGRWFGRGKRK